MVITCEICKNEIQNSDICYNILTCQFDGPTEYDLMYQDIKAKLVHNTCLDNLLNFKTTNNDKHKLPVSRAVEKSSPMSILDL